jgi:ATP-dependent RNA helicase DDX52/ROK1
MGPRVLNEISFFFFPFWDPRSTRYLILDEADRLLSSQFIDQTRPIVAACSHPAIQKAFLSATMESGPETEARRLLKDGGVRVVVGVK